MVEAPARHHDCNLALALTLALALNLGLGLAPPPLPPLLPLSVYAPARQSLPVRRQAQNSPLQKAAWRAGIKAFNECGLVEYCGHHHLAGLQLLEARGSGLVLLSAP
ncbi:hypothetical protein P154DRAFT_581222 [Amniculicola lignicola CBS 123094]|uniref:Uncharacterized protein n=1 Tax=Amniculicola lignicola CBS 123094 TaxID=1392246 RepID=A0A6A5WBT2_9PLEO|nr:hypothetical protein P154DRAFT_581222 [Amniculicola lignicola CBS 123094]